MSDTGSPLGRSIGWTGTLRWLIAVAATMAVATALYEHRYALAIAGLVFLIVAVAMAVRAGRAGRDAGGNL